MRSRIALVWFAVAVGQAAPASYAQDSFPRLPPRELLDPLPPAQDSGAGSGPLSAEDHERDGRAGQEPRDPMERNGPMGGNGPPGYAATWYPSRPVHGAPSDLGLVRQGLNLGVPIWRDGGDAIMATLGGRASLFDTDAILPDTQRPFPDQLWNLTVGLNYLHRFENGWSGMLMGGFGSASDKPFHSIREVTANLGGFLRFPAANGRDTWQVGAMYMVGGPVNFPLPLVSYGWNPSETFHMNIGLPLSLYWRPAHDWTVDVSYAPLLNINAKLTYQLTTPLSVYGGYEYLNESYYLADRPNRNDRFFGFEQRVVTGIKWDVASNASVDFNGGYSFGRFYGSGASPFGALHDRVDIAPGPFLGLGVRLRF